MEAAVELVPIDPTADHDDVVAFLTGNVWEFHVTQRSMAAQVEERLAGGLYAAPAEAGWWVRIPDDRHAGIAAAHDLDDGTPLIDLRIAEGWRGRGLGHQALAALSGMLFERDPELTRIEGTTRADNRAMQRVFEDCGYVQEARYREAWPLPDGGVTDSLGYAILRREWAARP